MTIRSTSLFHLPAFDFRRTDERPDNGVRVPDEILSSDTELPGIRCPLCKWRPSQDSVWICWDCDHPEYFSNGCGTEWNTFETRGRCPTCGHQWIWTSCQRCFVWSKHDDWYERSSD